MSCKIRVRRTTAAGLLGIVVAWASSAPFTATASEPAFPGAVGFGVQTPAGRGGRVIKVTNLNRSRPGSFAEAAAAKGPRIVVFEVGGVIDLDANSLRITEPRLTVAGQTAPSA